MPNARKRDGGKRRWLTQYKRDASHALRCCRAGRLPCEHAPYLEHVLANGHMPTPAELGAMLKLTYEQREANRLWTIPPIDKTKLKALKREAHRRREERRRRRDGAMTRATYLASVKTEKPWLALGESRATYYRRKGKRETGFVTRPKPQ
jgi:hypothetical protein